METLISSVLIILKILGLSWFIVRFDPIKWIFELLPNKIRNNFIVNVLFTLLNCLKCTSFWLGLIFGGIWIALISSYIGFWYEEIIGRQERKIRL